MGGPPPSSTASGLSSEVPAQAAHSASSCRVCLYIRADRQRCFYSHRFPPPQTGRHVIHVIRCNTIKKSNTGERIIFLRFYRCKKNPGRIRSGEELCLDSGLEFRGVCLDCVWTSAVASGVCAAKTKFAITIWGPKKTMFLWLKEMIPESQIHSKCEFFERFTLQQIIMFRVVFPKLVPPTCRPHVYNRHHER